MLLSCNTEKRISISENTGDSSGLLGVAGRLRAPFNSSIL